MKWYANLNAKEMVVEFSRMYHNSVACAIQGDNEEAEMHFDEFTDKMNEVIPLIVNQKAEFYMYNKPVYMEWEKCHRDILYIKNQLDRDLEHFYQEM